MNWFGWIKPALETGKRFAVKNASGLLMGFATVDSILALIFASKGSKVFDARMTKAKIEKTAKVRGMTEDEVRMLNKPKLFGGEDETEPVILEPLSGMEKAEVILKSYGPAVLMELLSIGCFWGAHWIDIRRQAVLMGLATTAEEALREYQRKVQETLGKEGEKEIRNAQAQDFVNNNPPPQRTYILDGDTEREYVYKGQYFRSTYYKIKEAQNLANHEMIQHMYFTESELMWLLDPDRRDLKPDSDSGSVGWNVDKLMVLDISWGTNPYNHEPVGIVTVYDMDGLRYDPKPGYSAGL